ncbi:DUF1501 domain-containing protein [Spirilliplanes yamanashiensis]|uniref:DUF1501 domain-containing protein n=1 Tax=Spirilliplanes yamanashiensis TaxID=42233 RepID=A0A8J3YA30_9ACTN|nr:DUF1501 domain-containing protein [Spirilliplanes yamanashiensis]MDP9817997.1 uncharacterized protein (DUF1501 family) [Spirilliplanes yamanashiensis]GIJ04806.1 hypothetical protein Sya03_41580 [Spirilliplanes yamanashiensis]
MSRRGLLGRALTAGAAGALAGLAGEGLSTRLAFADAGTPPGDVLVVVSLRGGFDGLTAIAPIGDPAYYAARPTIALPKAQAIAGDGMFGLHPALAPLLPLWQGGQLAAVHAVGQANPSRSHFAAMEEMERAAAGTSVRTGWLDRLLTATGATDPLSGASVGSAMPGRLLAGPAPDIALPSVDGFTLAGESSKRKMAAALRGLYADAPEPLAAVARSADAALAGTGALRAAGYTPANGAVYPATPLGGALKDVARLIKGGVGLRAAAVDSGDWDMHEGLGTAVKGQRMFDNLTATATALAAFAADLGADGMKSVTVVTVSEFGRRVAENGSKGVDHGYGNAMLLLGGGLRGGKVYGTWPGLAPDRLVAGDLAATTDYRAVIGEILQQRCGVGALTDVFPGVTPTSFGLAAAR